MPIFSNKSNFLAVLIAGALSFQGMLLAEGYKLTKLVSNIPGNAPHLDPNLVNPWGLTFDLKHDLVVADNGTSLATSYTPKGSILKFVINVPNAPTGLEKPDSESRFIFQLGDKKYPAHYLFSTEEGKILAYNRKADRQNAIVVADRSIFNSVYKGLALSKNRLYATDFHNGNIDVFDRQFNFLFSFTDTTVPTGFAPFNVRIFNNNLYVTFAKQLAPDNHDDEAGLGNGFVDIFSLDGILLQRLISQGELDSPWGLAMAPKEFSRFSHALLVGNFGNGVINAYDPVTGSFLGSLTNRHETIISINGLWSIKFNPASKDPHALYFTAGTDDEANGTVGKITPNNSH